MGWQWHQLDHMQIICTLLQTDNHASTSPLSFYRPDAPPAAQPTASKHWRQTKQSTECKAFKIMLNNLHPMMLESFWFTDNNIFTLAAPRNPQNDRLYAHPPTKKKGVMTKRLRTQLTFSHWWCQSASNKWLTLHQFDTCQSLIQG